MSKIAEATFEIDLKLTPRDQLRELRRQMDRMWPIHDKWQVRLLSIEIRNGHRVLTYERTRVASEAAGGQSTRPSKQGFRIRSHGKPLPPIIRRVIEDVVLGRLVVEIGG